MKSNRKNPLLAAVITVTLTASSAFAVPYYWDIDAATPGAGGATPNGNWDTLGTTWSPDSTGSSLTPAYTTLSSDDLTFSAGMDAIGSFTINLTTAQNAKSLTFEEGIATISGAGGTINLAAGGGITVAAGAGDPIVSSSLSITGGTIFNVGAGRLLTLDTGTFTRSTRAALNVQGLGNGKSTMPGLSANVNNIVGPWASLGLGAATTYVKLGGTGNVDGLGYTGGTDGVAVATSTLVVTGAGNLNYSLSAAGTLGASANVNTLRYTGAAGTLTASTLFTTKGIMNTGGGSLLLANAVTAGAAATEMVVNTANGNIGMTGAAGLFTGAINKTGSGTFTLGNGAAHSISGITVNEGVLVSGHLNGDALGAATINSGGTLRFGSSNKHNNGAVITINAGGIFDVAGSNDTIGSIQGTGSVTGTSAGYLQFSAAGTFSGDVGGGMGIRTSSGSSNIVFAGANTYTGGTQINVGSLQFTKLFAMPATGVVAVASGTTLAVNLGGAGEWTTGTSGNGTLGGLLAGLGGQAGGTVTYTGAVTLGLDTGNASPTTQTYSGIIANVGTTLGISKRGANTLTLDQANTYSGNTRVVAGKIVLANALALQNSAYDTSSVAGGLDLTGITTPTLGGLTGSVNLSEALITGYSSISNLTFNPGAGVTQTYSGDVGNGNGSMTLTKSGAGTQALTGISSHTGGTFVTSGALSFRNLAAKPAGTQNFTGSATLGLGVSATDPLLFTSGDIDNAFAGNMVGNLSNITIAATTNIGIDTTAANFTYSTSVPDSPTRGLVKLGANTLTLTGTNTYTGTTDIQAGTLQIGENGTIGTLGTGNVTNAGTLTFNRTDAYALAAANLVTGTGAVTLANTGSVAAAVDAQFNTTGALNFGASAGSTTVSALDLTNGSSTFGSMVVRTDSASANTINIGSGKTLQLNGAVTVGYNSAANSTTKLTATGAGNLSIGTNLTPTNANVQVGAGITTAISNAATLDLSALPTVYANLGTGTFRAGNTNNSAGTAAAGSTVILAADSTIQAAALTVAGWDSGVTQTLKLGSGASVFNADAVNVAGVGGSTNGDGRSNGNLSFNGAAGTLKIRSLADPVDGRATLNVAHTAMNTGASPIGLFDTTGHSADLRFGLMTIGARTTATGAGSNPQGEFKFDTGTLDANDLVIGIRNQAAATGIVTLGGGTVTINNTTAAIRVGSTANTVGTGTGTLNISGGTVTTAAFAGNSVILGNAAFAGATATGTLNLTGGALSVGGDIVRGATTGTSTATVKISGGTLNMNGNDIGTLASAVTLTAESGTLSNVATLNGTGGLTKTTAGTLVLAGTHTYSGNTLVSEGTLTLNSANPGNDASTMTIEPSAFLNLNYTGTDRVLQLFIGGVQQAAGVYGPSATPLPQITGTGTLTVGPSYGSWAADPLKGNIPGQPASGDFDNDGLTNLVEYALGKDPRVSSQPAGVLSGDTITYTKGTDAIANGDVSWVIETSETLATGSWTAEPVIPGATISYTFTPGTPVKKFARLKVTQIP